MVDGTKEVVKASNLGGYQWLTTVANKVGGPKNFVLMIAGAGAVVYKGGEAVVKYTVKVIKKMKNKEQVSETVNAKMYTVNADGMSNEELEFKIGDQFRVLKSDKDTILIEKIGDNDNPYFVSAELLKNISDFEC